MGGVLSWLISGGGGGGHGRKDDPDPITQLTSHDIYLIQNSWLPIRKQLTKYGIDVLIALFEKYPNEKHYFPFKQLTNQQLIIDKKFHAHCNRVMHNLDAIVENIANVELLIEILNNIGESHHKHQVLPQSFWNLKIVIVDTFKNMMNRETLDAWDRALDVAFSVIVKHLQ